MIAVGASARPSCVWENYQRSVSCVRIRYRLILSQLFCFSPCP
jgi:hypothetical protein